MRVLIACEHSGAVRDAFIDRGHCAWSVDLLPGEGKHVKGDMYEGGHYQGSLTDCEHFLGDFDTFDLLIAHPPCTYLCNSGVRWLHTEDGRWDKMFHGAGFFSWLMNMPIARKAVENPIMHKYAKQAAGCGDPTQIIQPWQFGHKAMKATGLWLHNLPALVPTTPDNRPPADKEERKAWQQCHRASPGPDRWKLRSATYTGIATAMARQWGDL